MFLSKMINDKKYHFALKKQYNSNYKIYRQKLQLRKSKLVWVKNHPKKFHQNWPINSFTVSLRLIFFVNWQFIGN